MTEGLNISMKELKNAYGRGENIIQLLNARNSVQRNILNKTKYIEIAYDLQAGSYVKAMRDPGHYQIKKTICEEMAEIVKVFISSPCSILKGGVGEAVTLVPFLKAFEIDIENAHGFDISWSRLNHARFFLKENGFGKVKLCTGTLQSIPFTDNSFDLVLTSHSLEPNGGDEEKILRELYRVTSDIVALFEPSYDFANDEGKERMDKNGYVKNLKEVAKNVGFDILLHQPLKSSMNSKNPTAALVLKKKNDNNSLKGIPHYACPLARTELTEFNSGYFSKDSFLFYPIIEGIPVLRKENAVLTSDLSN